MEIIVIFVPKRLNKNLFTFCRAMRSFLRNILVFSLPLIVLAFGADYIISSTLKRSNVYAEGEYRTWNAIYGGMMNCDIAIYGSSRAWVQIDPIILGTGLGGRCYNFGMDGHNFWAQNFRHEEFLKYNKKPGLILHSLDVTTLSDRGNLYNSDQFLPYMLFNKDLDSFAKNYDSYSAAKYWVPLIRYAGKSKAIFHSIRLLLYKQSMNDGRIQGFKGQRRKQNGYFDLAQGTFKPFDVKLDSGCIALFENYLVACQRQQIALVLVYSPEYIKGQPWIRNRAEILGIYHTLSKRHNIPFLDYSHDPISFEATYFYNAGHLNKTGAELFTNQLASDLKKLNLGPPWTQ